MGWKVKSVVGSFVSTRRRILHSLSFSWHAIQESSKRDFASRRQLRFVAQKAKHIPKRSALTISRKGSSRSGQTCRKGRNVTKFPPARDLDPSRWLFDGPWKRRVYQSVVKSRLLRLKGCSGTYLGVFKDTRSFRYVVSLTPWR